MQSPASDVIKNSLLIRAGAGAGKTTLLIKTFIEFCTEFEIQHKRLPRIAITTFTRKATQEVKERLSVKALEKKDDKLFQHINKKSSVHISTIHGLLTLLVQENADLLGLPQNIKIVDQNLYKKSLKKLVRQLLKNSPQYLEILEHYSFVRLIDWILSAMEALRQQPELAVISSSQLADVTAQKLQQLQKQLALILQLTGQVPETWVAYFDYLSQLNQALLQKSIGHLLQLSEEKPAKPRWNKKSPAFSEDTHAAIENFWDDFDLSIIDTPEYFTECEKLTMLFLNLVQEIYKNDNERKMQSGEITINDLELFSVELVRRHPEAVVDFSNKFDYYMIDEYQDTSPLQVEILDTIIGNKPHFIVGDPQQSIYLFRGARSEVFLIKQRLAAANEGTLSLKFLDTNYRSQPSVMNFINDYFQHMSSQFEPMKTNPNKQFAKAPVNFIQAENEAVGVLQHITQLLQSGISAKDICVLSRRNQNLVKVAALAQKVHVPVQLQISSGFDQKREVLDLISILKFLVNPHDNENLILLIRSPWAYVSDTEIATAVKLDRSLWFALVQQSQNQSSNQQLIKTVQSLANYFANYQKLGVSEAFVEFIKMTNFLDYSQAYDSSGKREANYWKFFAHLKNAERSEGFSLAKYLSENFQFFQSDLGSSQSEATPVVQPDRVSLMTIHASKGLEFAHVIVVGFSEQPMLTLYQPLSVSLDEGKISLAPYVVSESKNAVSRWGQQLRQEFNKKETDEHERLLYVALTRAQEGLALVAETKSRQVSTSWQKKSFWPEAGTHEHEHYDLISSVADAEVTKWTPQRTQVVMAKEKLVFKNAHDHSTSVTDSLQTPQAQASSKVDYDQKINDILKAKKGTDLHRLFESLQIFTKNSQMFDRLQKNLSTEQKKSIQYLLQVTDYPLHQLIKQGHVEWGFGLNTAKGLLQGQIDLWGIHDQQIYILDYKTGSSQYSEKAYQQLLFYAHCLYKMNKLDFNMKLNFIVTYPLEQKTLSKSYENYAALLKQTTPAVSALFE